MKLDEETYLAHYGILRRSGRYPWGSGKDQPTRNRMFLDHVEDLKKQGLSEVEICTGLGIGSTDKDGNFHPSTTKLRAAKSIAKNQQKQAEILMAQRLKDKGYSNVAIGLRMNKNESYVRTLLAPGAKDKADILVTTSESLKAEVADKKYLDVGAGTEYGMGVSSTMLNTAIATLQEQGYVVHAIKERQIATGKDTTRKILTPPGTPWSEVQQNRDKIQLVTAFSQDHGRSFLGSKILPPMGINPRRVAVNYKEDGGDKLDGVIYVRPGVKDISLGGNRYAQVRVKVGDNHFLKGMAMYKDDLPKGVDLQFNTNKSDTGNKLDAMKPLEKDPDLPFGSLIQRQITEKDEHGNEHLTSAMNIINEEGRWAQWSKSIASQVLSKQSPILARTQLDVTYERRKQELADINALTNPTVKRKLLESFAESTDAAAVHLKAAALPRQASHVILPIESLPETEVYAPNYRNGERVVLIRYPHGGTFEIPELTVNNNHPEAKRVLGNAQDAIGIHHNVAVRLSGADFDGDSVLVIPNNSGRVKSTPALEALKDFDPMKYKIPEGSDIPIISKERVQPEMGMISNLITDMTIRGASHDEIARAVKHSMVVIDSNKHGLDIRASALDNGIVALKKEYQSGPRGGASTLISKAKSPKYLNERKARPHAEGGPIDTATGRRVFVDTNRMKTNIKGESVPVKKRFAKLAVTDNAHDLIDDPGTPMERLYADHSNRLKDLANQARLHAVNTPSLKYSPSAKRIYAPQVQSLNDQFYLADRNRPLERQAQAIANTVVRAKRDANPNLEPDELKKIKFQALAEARNRMGAKKHQIQISDKEWEAIQAGAISNSRLSDILTNADLDKVRELATPRTQRTMTTSMTARAKQMLSSGYTRGEVSEALGVSLSTLDRSTKEGE